MTINLLETLFFIYLIYIQTVSRCVIRIVLTVNERVSCKLLIASNVVDYIDFYYTAPVNFYIEIV